MKRLLFSLAVATMATITPSAASGSVYLSNLQNRFTSGGIGDIHNISAYGPTTVSFSTGSQETILRAVTLEFLAASGFPDGWQTVDLVLRPLTGGSGHFSLGEPRLNPLPTQWPRGAVGEAHTVFVDFHPATTVILPPLTPYEVLVSWRLGTPNDGGLLFSLSNDYQSIDGWQWGQTLTENPFATGQELKLAITATAVPEPATSATFAMGFGLLWLFARRQRQRWEEVAVCPPLARPPACT